MEKRVLIIEDDPDIVELLRYNFVKNGFQVEDCGNGEDGLRILEDNKFDLLILDLMLPERSGLEVCREIRRDPELVYLPVIMLTARGEEMDKVIGLELGADDYVTKPFSVRELIARSKALLRRATPKQEVENTEKLIEVAGLRIEPDLFVVSRENVDIELTAMEFRLLHYLACHPNRIFSRDQLLDAVWGSDHFVMQRSVDVYVSRLREKIEIDPDRPTWLKTKRGIGYWFETGAP